MEKLNIFHHLVAMAAADGKFTESELKMLAVRANQWNVSEEQFQDALQGVKNNTLKLEVPTEISEKAELLKNMMHMMAIDGKLAEEEKRLCATASATMGFSDRQFDSILDDLIQTGTAD